MPIVLVHFLAFFCINIFSPFMQALMRTGGPPVTKSMLLSGSCPAQSHKTSLLQREKLTRLHHKQ
jgi:hypothetical protein